MAAETSAAAKARRNNDDAEIVIYEKDQDISYSGCGLPYYIGGIVKEINELTPRDPEFFRKKYNLDIRIRHEVLSVDPVGKTLSVRNLVNGEVFEDHYDLLVLATGASSIKPEVEGIRQEHVFFLRNIQDGIKIRQFIDQKHPKTAIILGTGYIGLEMLENLELLGIDVTMMELADKITPNLDLDMAEYLETLLINKGVKILKSTRIISILEDTVKTSDGSELPADMVLVAVGVKPNSELARSIGLELGVKGAIRVNAAMQTSNPDIYACGDCVETFSQLTGEPVFRPLGSTANKTGRIAGDAMTGGPLRYHGNLGTGIFKVFDLAVGSTGLTEKEAIEKGYDTVVAHNIKPSRAGYFGGEDMTIKSVADRKTGSVLGAQIIGKDGVDKRLDVFATLISCKAKVDELFDLDLAYSPPFSTTKDPVHYSGMIMDNIIRRGRPLITVDQLNAHSEDYQIIDTRSEQDYREKGSVDGACNYPQEQIRTHLGALDPEKPVVTYCNRGTTGNAVQNILLNHDFKEVYNLSGGHKFYSTRFRKGRRKDK